MRFLPILIFIPLLAAAGEAPIPAKIEYNRDVRPILSENCFKCHGPDQKKREAKRRLDTRDGALAENDGVRAIVPGKLDDSESHVRIHSTDKEEKMPPPDSGKKLTPREVALLDRWIAQGAEYQDHWAYIPPARATTEPGKNPIDSLVRQHLAVAGFQPSAEADRHTLIRRVSFDLIGLPPTPDEVATFANDTAPDAYARLIERLLASPHFGERMAIPWLDVVRFADTAGYHSDNPRSVWAYRDYVIAAFNNDKPFDQFTIEQIAGDLLPESTREQKVASAFNRLLLSTEEGGAQAKDYEARMLTDRVRAVGTVWLGATIGCAQCHDHKFDPISARDFYTLGAFFADIREPIIGRREPGMLLSTPAEDAKLADLDKALATAETQVDAPMPELAAAELQWEFRLDAEAIKKLPKEIRAAVELPLVFRTAEQNEKIAAHFRTVAPQLAEARATRDAAKKARDDFDATLPRCLVSESSPTPRTVRMLPRGDWMNETGEIVQPALPHFLPQPKIEAGQKLTRLDLARWLVSRDNPLTARVFVNRLWKQFFGIGLSKVLDDLGAQGEPPIQPALLDWLACEFMEPSDAPASHPWDVKHLVRLIVNSETYRQTSLASKELQARDPDNRELARQSRWRLDAELVRDNALSIAGLLAPKIGGPSVKPYQPAGYWENLNFPAREWQSDEGRDQYRRGLYTWWQRSYMHPSLLAFDAPTREECTAERNRSNIPQQALVLLNDPTYVEAARVFAAQILQQCGCVDRLKWAFEQALSREPREDERHTLDALLEENIARYRQDEAAAEALLKVGIAPLPDAYDAAELAAWTNIARVILNLHETITRS